MEKENYTIEFLKGFIGAGLCWTALILVCLFSFGCAANTPNVPTYDPSAPVAEAPEPVEDAPEKNPFEGAVSFLRTLLTITPTQLEEVCGDFGGEYMDNGEGFFACQKELQGFSIFQNSEGKVTSSSILAPATGAQQLATAVVEEVGEPDRVTIDAAVWALDDGATLIFAPVSSVAIILVLDIEDVVAAE